MGTEPQLAFYRRQPEPPGLGVRATFGVFAFRPATAAEIDELAQALLTKVGEISIVAEDRHEIGEDSEASLHQVRVEVDPEYIPVDEHEADVLAGRIVEAAESWARDCAAERRAEVSEP
jgi:predicted polyphosphate/ATP-dependent NAD kinase